MQTVQHDREAKLEYYSTYDQSQVYKRNTRLQLKKADVRRWRVQLTDRVLYTTEHCIYPTQRLLWWSPIPAPTNWVQETLSVFTKRKLCGRRGNFSLFLCQSAKHGEGNISVIRCYWWIVLTGWYLGHAGHWFLNSRSLLDEEKLLRLP